MAVIQRAVRTLLDSPAYRANAQALGRQIIEDARRSPAVSILEEVAASRARDTDDAVLTSAR